MQLFEMFCLSVLGLHDLVETLTNKYGTIATLWIGSYLCVVLTEAKYVEVSMVALAL